MKKPPAKRFVDMHSSSRSDFVEGYGESMDDIKNCYQSVFRILSKRVKRSIMLQAVFFLFTV